MSDKEKVVANLFASSGADNVGGTDTKKKVLIEEVGGSSSDTKNDQPPPSNSVPPTPPQDEGPSLLEQMMAAQQQAKRQDDVVKAKIRAKEEKKALGGGFKKGFFGGGDSTKNKKTKPKPKPKQTDNKDTQGDIPTITAKKGTGGAANGVVEEVQRALREEEEQQNPLLQQLKGGEWATDDLMQQLQNDPVLRAGMQNPKCQAALQLMQTDPKEAKRRFEHDSDVATFMQAFSGLMAGHFTKLGQQQEQQQKAPPSPVIPEGQVEVGPLHAEAMARQREQKKAGKGIITEVNQEEEARVKEIVQDDELREMLLDPALQRILQECNDPQKFQKHMRDPVTAYKIKKLFDAGLVGTAK